MVYGIYTMILFSIEYQIKSNGECYLCKVLGTTESDVINDLQEHVGDINVESIYRICEVHRITKKIKTNIIELSTVNEKKKPVGRPKEYNLMRG